MKLVAPDTRAFTLASFCAVEVGCLVASASGVARSAWARNAAAARSGSRRTWVAAALPQLLLCRQPDGSQATAFAAAMIVVCLLSQLAGRSRIGISLFFVLAASFAWTRPDPLQSVPEVEGIIGLALTVSPLLAMFCIASLAAAIALFTCFLVCALMPLLGAFPVPLVGMGMSPILGYWLGIGTLIAVKATS